MTDKPPLWETRVITPHGPATDESSVKTALALCNLEGAEIQPLRPDDGYWLIGYPPSQTTEWTLERTGGGVIWPGRDEGGRLWMLDVPIS